MTGGGIFFLVAATRSRNALSMPRISLARITCVNKPVMIW
jgi:hypothetical protein